MRGRRGRKKEEGGGRVRRGRKKEKMEGGREREKGE